MKTFESKKRTIAESTMTVGDLIKHLAQYPITCPVFATWEGVTVYITPGIFSLENVNKGQEEETRTCLIIDVNAY